MMNKLQTVKESALDLNNSAFRKIFNTKEQEIVDIVLLSNG